MPHVEILKVDSPRKIVRGVPFKIFFRLHYRSLEPFKLFFYIIEKRSKVLVSYTKHIHHDYWHGHVDGYVNVVITSDIASERLLCLAGWTDEIHEHHHHHHLGVDNDNDKDNTT